MLSKHIIDHSKWVESVVSGKDAGASGPLDQQVARSWARSLAQYHLDPGRTVKPRILTGSSLRSFREPIEPFLQIARHGIDRLHRQVSEAGYVILLSDAHGVTVEFQGNPRFDRELKDAGLYLGACWSEAEEGTCGVGTCIADGRPITIHKAEHFRAPNISLTCTAAPIFDPDGTLVAVLDASALYSPDAKHSQCLVMQLVRQTARLIEDAGFLHRFRDHWVLRFSRCWEFLEVEAEGLLALDGQGRALAGNRAVLERFGQVAGRPVEGLFQARFEALLRQAATPGGRRFELHGADGVLFHAVLQEPRQRAPKPPAAARRPLEAAPGLEQLAGADRRMLDNVARVRRVLDRDIPILLRGETGTGKEVFARALHLASRRADKPFVALNCAAIPESLIESELFGYRDGAFTGARAKGMRGKLVQSSGGTLFLDEIGDMPLALQTRLLRVLAEREVLPLGAETAIPVDLSVICATHRDLETMVAEGRFREDLYFRLNGMTLTLPPLRERGDRAWLIETLLAAETGGEAVGLEPSTLAVLLDYSWPGNIRQLRHVLRYAVAVREGERIRVADLPAELLEPRPLSAPAPVDASGGERERLLAALRRHRWVVAAAARELGVCRATVYRRMQKLRIVPPNALDT